MADVKKGAKSDSKKPKVKEMTKDEAKKTRGGLANQVGGGAAGPLDFFRP